VQKRKNEEAQLSIDKREGKLHADYQSRGPKPSTMAEPSSSAWGQARLVGAGEADGVRRGRRGLQATDLIPESASTEG